MDALVEIRNLSAGYGQNIVLRDVNLSIQQFDFVGVIGPNGGGKTTLLKALLGLLSPMSGEINFSESMTEGNSHRIGYLPQINNIDRKFPVTVFDVVRSGLMCANVYLDVTTAQRMTGQMILWKKWEFSGFG